MDLLWAPWRMAYIKAADRQRACVFCRLLRRKDGRANLVLARGRHTFAVLNRFPYNTGHLMIAPLAHKLDLARLTPEERLELVDLTVRAQQALDTALHPHGYNLGINLGRVAGAGVLGHVHLHVVPRWTGDTNFMPVTGGAKVMPFALPDLYRRLAKAMNRRPRTAD